jgi:isoamylase
LSWVSWNLTPPQQSLLDFVRTVIAHRHAHPILRRRHFFEGRKLMAGCEKDLTWFDANGEEMTAASWGDAARHTLGMRLYGLELDEPDVRGMPFAEDVLFAMFHASDTPAKFVLPACSTDAHWVLLLDTAASPDMGANCIYPEMSAYPLQGRSVVLLRQERQVPAGRGVTPRGRGRPRRRSSDYRSQ